MLYHGLSVLGGGAVLSGMVLAAITVFIIDREFTKAAAFAAAGAVLTFFGLMHGESVGVGQTPAVAVSYLILTAFLFGAARYGAKAPSTITVPVDAARA